MKKIVAITAFALLASCAAFVQSSPHASADAICFNNAAPTPLPITGRPTLGICNNNILGVQIVGGSGTPLPTAIPAPTDANGYPIVHPTAVGTLSVNCAAGCTGSTPIPFATNASGQLIVAPTAIPTVNVLIQNTSIPITAATTIPVSFTGSSMSMVNACNTSFSACSNVGTTVSDGYSDLLESIFSTGFVYNFNGTSWDRGRNAGIGNGVPSTGLGAHDTYGEFLTVLPTLTTGQYGSMQLDSSSRLIISPTGLPTPVPLPTNAAGYPDVTVCSMVSVGTCVTVSNNALALDANATTSTLGYTADFGLGYNGATYDRLRTSGVGNTVASTGLLAATNYCENLTTLPTLTNATYGAEQCDTSGRRIGVGAGVAGTPAGGVASVQGVSGGTVLGTQQYMVGTNGALVTPQIGDSSVVGTGTANVQIVALTAGKAVYVTGYSLTALGTSPIIELVTGTGTNCASGTVNLTSTIIGATMAQASLMLYPSSLAGQTSAELCVAFAGTITSASWEVFYNIH